MKKIALAVLLLTALSFAKSRDWQECTVYKMTRGKTGATAQVPIGNMTITGPLISIHYFVATAELDTELAAPHTLNITINKVTHIAFDGDKAYLIDDEGKERKLRVIQKVAKEPPKKD